MLIGGMTIGFRLASQPDIAVLTTGHSVSSIRVNLASESILVLQSSWHHLGGRYDALPDPAALQGAVIWMSWSYRQNLECKASGSTCLQKQLSVCGGLRC